MAGGDQGGRHTQYVIKGERHRQNLPYIYYLDKNVFIGKKL